MKKVIIFNLKLMNTLTKNGIILLLFSTIAYYNILNIVPYAIL